LEQWKVTRAQVVEAKAAFWHEADAKKVINVLPNSALKFLNQEIDTNNKVTSWRTFADDPNLPFEKTGFAVASPQLILREGKRIVEFDIKLSSFDLLDSELQLDDFELYISTEKGWTKLEHDETLYGANPEDKREETAKIGAFDLLPVIDTSSIEGSASTTHSILGLKLIFILEKDFEAIDKIPSDTGISSEWPALKVFFPPSWGERAIRFEEITIEVDVRDIQENLIIQTDQGIFDGTKTIFPFGPIPELGNRFFVGSTEVFQKSLTSLGVNFGWIAPPDSFLGHYNRYFGRPQPKLRIDFIDAAEAIGSGLHYSSQISTHLLLGNYHFGALGRKIRFKVLDINGGEIPSTEVESVSIGSEVSVYKSTTDEHEVTISSFNNPNFSINSPTKNYRYFGHFGWLGNPSVYYDLIEIYLLPDRVVLEKTPEEDQIEYFIIINLPDEARVVKNNLKIIIEGTPKSDADITVVTQGFRFTHPRPLITSTIRIEYLGHQAIDILNPLGLTKFEVNLKPTVWTPGQIALDGTVADDETGKLKVFNAFRDTEPVKDIKISIGAQIFTTNANGEIDLGPDFVAGAALQISHFQYETVNLTIPADYVRHNLKVEINPLTALYVMQANVTDYFLDLLSGITIAANVQGQETHVFENSGSDAVLLKLPPQMVIPALNFKVSQGEGNFKSFDLTLNDLLSKRGDGFPNESLSVFAVRLESAGDNSFDLISPDSKIISNFDNIAIAAQMLKRDTRTQHFTQYSPTLKRGFIRFTLQNTDFFHKQYPKLLGIQANAGQINEPYTPSINSLSLSYKSRQEIVEPQDGYDGFFHLTPFEGYKEILLKKTPETPTFHLLPSFSSGLNANNADVNFGNLFIGLEQFLAGDNLSLLIQLEEGSEQNFDLLPPKIEWFYLAKNEWKPLDAEKILKDTTYQLTRSGLIQLAIPSDATIDNTILNAKYHWISARVVEGPNESINAFASIISIRAQALEAVFAPTERSFLTRLEKPLDALIISKLETSRSAVKKVEQPFASFGGRKPESDSGEYHRRVSERLRHKDRAVTAWDYEHLLLEQYSLVAVAKCIPHTRYESSGEYTVASELAPGFVSMAVVPDLLRRPNMVREEPRFSRGDLNEMRDFLLPKTNLFLQPLPAIDSSDPEDHFLQVVNPQYEPIHIALKVWLRRGADENLAKYQINEALRRYLAPWLYDQTQGPTFGREIRRSKLVQLIENLDAVDVIQELKVYQSVVEKFPTDSLPPDGDWEPFEVPGTLITPQTARSILTTVLQHQIELAKDNTGGTVVPRKVSGPPPIPVAEKKEALVAPKSEAKTVRKAPGKVSAKPKSSTSNRK
ncbi:MAG: hypothetical protein KA138_10920, partial [Saprospiraceae bacterium]|nr:hypothetical protein [Saprospiraceae bacterium]